MEKPIGFSIVTPNFILVFNPRSENYEILIDSFFLILFFVKNGVKKLMKNEDLLCEEVQSM